MYRDATVLLRLTQGDEVLFEGEIKPGHEMELPGGIELKVLWIRDHSSSPGALKSSPTRDRPDDP